GHELDEQGSPVGAPPSAVRLSVRGAARHGPERHRAGGVLPKRRRGVPLVTAERALEFLLKYYGVVPDKYPEQARVYLRAFLEVVEPQTTRAVVIKRAVERWRMPDPPRPRPPQSGRPKQLDYRPGGR